MATATRSTGFPVQATSTESIAVNPKKVGDLMIVAGRRGNNVSDITGITGGGCTNWTKVVDHADASNFIYAFLWMGTVSTVGSSTLTLTVTDPGVSSEFNVDSWTTTAAGTWKPDVSSSTFSGAGVPAFASLTPTKAASSPISELYYGWMFTTGGYTAGSTAGYTYETTPFGDGPVVWNANVTSGAQKPAITAPSATYVAVAAIFYLAPAPPVMDCV